MWAWVTTAKTRLAELARGLPSHVEHTRCERGAVGGAHEHSSWAMRIFQHRELWQSTHVCMARSARSEGHSFDATFATPVAADV